MVHVSYNVHRTNEVNPDVGAGLGANIAGFVRVAEAMEALGVV